MAANFENKRRPSTTRLKSESLNFILGGKTICIFSAEFPLMSTNKTNKSKNRQNLSDMKMTKKRGEEGRREREREGERKGGCGGKGKASKVKIWYSLQCALTSSF